MPEALEDVLRLVAEGRLTAEEAAPIVEALTGARPTGSRRPEGAGQRGPGAPGTPGAPGAPGSAGSRTSAGGPGTDAASGRRLRIAVHDSGRRVVEVVLPGALASLAGSIPGIPAEYISRVRRALAEGMRGPVVDVRDEAGDGVTITVE